MYSQNPLWDSVGQGFIYPANSLYMDTFQGKAVVYGNFKKIGNKLVNGVFLYDGVNIDSLKEGIDNTTSMFSIVIEACSYHGKLYVGGAFTQAGTKMIKNLAVWDGNDWDSLPASPNGSVLTMFVFNDELYVTGTFNKIGSSPSEGIAKWNDSTWTTFTGFQYQMYYAHCAAVYNNEVYIGGNSLSPTSEIVKFDGTTWSIPGGGISGGVTDLQVYHNKLYISGYFIKASGNAGDYIMSWDGSNYHQVVNSIDDGVNSLELYNGKLLAGGCCEYVNGVHTGALFMFDTVSFCTLSTPITNCITAIQRVNNTFLIGGGFTLIDTTNFRQIAQWARGNYADTCAYTIGQNEFFVKEKEINIYPNPTSSVLNIKSNLQNETTIQIMDLSGRLILEKTVASFEGEIQIDIFTINSGTYFLRFSNDGKIYYRKFLKS